MRTCVVGKLSCTVAACACWPHAPMCARNTITLCMLCCVAKAPGHGQHPVTSTDTHTHTRVWPIHHMASLVDARVAAASARFVHSGDHAMPPRWSPGRCRSQRAFWTRQTVLGSGARARRNGRVQQRKTEPQAAGRLESGAARAHWH
jgi:hypothetical protein